MTAPTAPTVPLAAAERLPCGAYLYARDGAPSSVNARHGRGGRAVPTLETLEREVAARVGRRVELRPAIGRETEVDPLYTCHEVPRGTPAPTPGVR